MLASSPTVDQLTLTPLQWLLLVGLVVVVAAANIGAQLCAKPPESDSEDLDDDYPHDLSQPVWFGPQRPAQPARKEDAKPHVPDVRGDTRRGLM